MLTAAGRARRDDLAALRIVIHGDVEAFRRLTADCPAGGPPNAPPESSPSEDAGAAKGLPPVDIGSFMSAVARLTGGG